MNYYGNSAASAAERASVLGNTRLLRSVSMGAGFLSYTPTAYKMWQNPTPGILAKRGLDAGMTSLSIWGGPLGLGISTVYFGIDYTIGVENLFAPLPPSLRHQASPVVPMSTGTNQENNMMGGSNPTGVCPASKSASEC